MRKDIPLPAAIALIVAAAVLIIGGVWWWTSRSRAGAVTVPLPSGQEQIQATDAERQYLMDALSLRNQRMRGLKAGQTAQ